MLAFDVDKFQAALAAQGKPCDVVNPAIRTERIIWHKQLEPFRPSYSAAFNGANSSDIAREIEAIKGMALFLAVYFFALGAKDCQDGIEKRFDNEDYLGGYAYQEEMVESFIMDYECAA